MAVLVFLSEALEENWFTGMWTLTEDINWAFLVDLSLKCGINLNKKIVVNYVVSLVE